MRKMLNDLIDLSMLVLKSYLVIGIVVRSALSSKYLICSREITITEE